jgi:3-oxoacid CoA-transferase
MWLYLGPGKLIQQETANFGKSSNRCKGESSFADTAHSYTTKSFAPLMAKAAKLSIVEAENIVEVGSIDPDDVDLPGIFIDRIVPATVEKHIENRKLKTDGAGVENAPAKSESARRRDTIARRTAKELKHGYYVNLGVGMYAESSDAGE